MNALKELYIFPAQKLIGYRKASLTFFELTTFQKGIMRTSSFAVTLWIDGIGAIQISWNYRTFRLAQNNYTRKFYDRPPLWQRGLKANLNQLTILKAKTFLPPQRKEMPPVLA